MRHDLRHATCLLLAVAAALLAGPALAGPDERRGHPRGEQRRAGDDPRGRLDGPAPYRGGQAERRPAYDAQRAAEAVRRDERGRVLSSEPTGERGYRVRVLTPDGYVRERYVDPRDERQR